MKKYLAFDASGDELVVCGFNGTNFVMSKEKGTGTEKMLVQIDKVLKELNMEIKDIEVLGVCVGPGSWTGSRVAICTALGIVSGLGEKIKVVAFNSFDLISYNGLDDGSVVVLKAYANFVYACSLSRGIECITKDDFAKLFEDKKIIARENIFGDEKIVLENKMREVVEDKISREEYSRIDEIEPLYLRKSQAEIQRESKNGK